MLPEPIESPIARGQWFKRIALVVVGLSVSAIAVRLTAGFVADRREGRQRAELTARGYPLDPAALNQPPIPDETNAAVAWRAAFAALNPTVLSPRDSAGGWETFGRFPPYTFQWRLLADASSIANKRAFERASAARHLTDADWGRYYTDLNTLIGGGLNQARSMANVLVDDFELQQVRGNSTASAERIESLLGLARALRSRPSLIDYLVSVGTDGMTTHALRTHVSTIDWPADRYPIVINALLDDAETRTFQHLIRAEVTLMASMRWTLPSALQNAWTVSPNLRRLQTHRMDQAVAVAEAIADVDLRASERRAEAVERSPYPRTDMLDPISQLTHRFADISDYSLYRVVRLRNESLARKQVAAIALAMRWYALEHAGQLPPQLEALVPRYLPRVPVSPLASPANEDYAYVVQRAALPDGRDRPLLRVPMYDGVEGQPTPLPSYELYWIEPSKRGEDRTEGRWSDLSSWTPTRAQLDAATP